MKKKHFVIALDGHSSCGKSTLARQLADKLDIIYVDSGAMYRAVTAFALENGCFRQNKLDKGCLIAVLPDIHIHFEKSSDENHTILNGRDVSTIIRSMEVSSLVSLVSELPEVREKMVQLQRKMAENQSLIMDGRDIGTVVFPDADVKIFLTAGEQIRAERRFKELNENGVDTTFDAVLNNIIQRDHIDSNRKHSPLRKAEDAVIIDNSKLNREEQLQKALKLVKEKLE
ncbi:MAG: (d)CMP kinase [Bacteroidales bacterium]